MYSFLSLWSASYLSLRLPPGIAFSTSSSLFTRYVRIPLFPLDLSPCIYGRRHACYVVDDATDVKERFQCTLVGGRSGTKWSRRTTSVRRGDCVKAFSAGNSDLAELLITCVRAASMKRAVLKFLEIVIKLRTSDYEDGRKCGGKCLHGISHRPACVHSVFFTVAMTENQKWTRSGSFPETELRNRKLHVLHHRSAIKANQVRSRTEQKRPRAVR